jgi:hypothetical protein
VLLGEPATEVLAVGVYCDGTDDEQVPCVRRMRGGRRVPTAEAEGHPPVRAASRRFAGVGGADLEDALAIDPLEGEGRGRLGVARRS